jgi:hypothetical protein
MSQLTLPLSGFFAPAPEARGGVGLLSISANGSYSSLFPPTSSLPLFIASFALLSSAVLASLLAASCLFLLYPSANCRTDKRGGKSPLLLLVADV